MFNILDEKKNETLMMLMSKLTRKNSEVDFALNSQSILIELSENENTYNKLIATI